MRNGTQASPLSIQITFSRGNRSGSPLTSQLVRCTRLKCTNDSACIDRKRLHCCIDWSPQWKPEWKPNGLPVASIAA